MKQCPNCRAEIEDSAAFCEYCDSPQFPNQSGAYASSLCQGGASPASQSAQSKKTNAPKNKIAKWIAIASAVTLAVVTAVLIGVSTIQKPLPEELNHTVRFGAASIQTNDSWTVKLSGDSKAKWIYSDFGGVLQIGCESYPDLALTGPQQNTAIDSFASGLFGDNPYKELSHTEKQVEGSLQTTVVYEGSIRIDGPEVCRGYACVICNEKNLGLAIFMVDESKYSEWKDFLKAVIETFEVRPE